MAIDYPDSTADIGYTYYDDGTLKTATRNNGSIWTYEYNSLSLIKKESLDYAGQVRQFLHGYNPRGHRKDLTWPDNSVTDYAPNVYGEPSRVGNYATSVSYLADGSLAGATLGTSISVTRATNMRFLPAQLHYAAGASLVNFSYVYDANANVERITDLRSGTDSQTFEYDGLNRLTVANAPGRYGNGATYAYDAFDDLRQVNVGTRNWTYRYEDNTGRVTRISNASNGTEWSFQYDARGNTDIAAGPTSTLDLVYDRADTLSQILGQESYQYDAHGHRIQAVVAGQARFPIHTRDGLLRIEYGLTTERYFHLGTQVVAKESAGVAKYLLTDHLGSPVAISDATGNVLPQDRSFFAPYGERWGTPPVRGAGYTGHFEDATGAIYMKARYQHPQIGRMLSPDPVLADSRTGGNFNRYWYANNNPMKFVDPDGRLPILIPVAIFVAKELGGEVVEQATGVSMPTIKNAGKGVAKLIVSSTKELRGGAFDKSKSSAITNAGGVCEYCGKNAATQGDHARTLNTYKKDANEGRISASDAKAEANSESNIIASCKTCNEVLKHTKDLGTGKGQFNPGAGASERVRKKLEEPK